MGIQCTQLILVISQCKFAHTYIMLLRHYCRNEVTSALESSWFERQRAGRFAISTQESDQQLKVYQTR